MTLQIDVRVRRGAFLLDATVEVAPGETLGVIGPNGSGKTSLLRVVAGLTPIDGGVIRFGGATWDDPAASRFVDPTRRRCPVVFQDYRLFPHLSVLDNVAYPRRVQGFGRREARLRASETLDHLGLADLADRRPRQLSGGQAQRVAVARALAADPNALLLDEPLAALDARTKQETRLGLKRALTEFAGPALLITHDPLEAMTLADRLLVLEAGRVVQLAAPRDVAARPATDYIARLVGINLYAGTLAEPGAVRLDAGGVLHTATDDVRPGQRVLVAVAPAAISLHLDEPHAISARNVWPATVRGLERLHDRIRLDLDGAPPAIADVTAQALAQLGLDVGTRVWLSAKATEVIAYTTAG